jgi:hypothetical protein
MIRTFYQVPSLWGGEGPLERGRSIDNQQRSDNKRTTQWNYLAMEYSKTRDGKAEVLLFII